MLLTAPHLPRPSRAAVEKALSLLDRKLGPSKVLTERNSLEPYANDDSEGVGCMPDAVVLAKTPADILAALAVAREAEVPITPRSGGTGRTGGAIPVAGGIVITTLGMNQIKDMDTREGIVVVEPGMVLGDLHRAVEEVGWFYPPDPNSWSSCAIGGNVAENAAGPRAFKYGATRNYVLGLETFLIGGDSFFAGRHTVKGVTGYDVTALLVGSEGTLAIFGDVTLRLIPKSESVMTLLALFHDVHAAGRAVEELTQLGIIPRCIELLDGGTLEAMRAAGNPINSQANAMLLMDVDGTESQCELQAEKISDACELASVIELLVAQDAAQRERLWSARREMSLAVRRLAKHKISEDVVVPRRHIGELLRRVDDAAEKNRVRSVTYGHAGDGNLHVNFVWNDDDEVPRVQACVEKLFRDTVELRGTLSGEHGIGIAKAPYLALEQSSPLIALQERLKHSFDPKGLLNPGKIFPQKSHVAC
ncbi:MAG: FAD-linked oxidase C-terminal domain-containing protein [Polyangiaceae bacterium]|nr:FAD-linked oxidase C-terminal domain-containing protein [Polyangiaceae bacterium]